MLVEHGTTLFDTEGNRENFLALFVHDPDSDPTKPTFKPVIKERTSKNSFICSYVGEECVLTKESDGKEKLFYKYTKTYNRYGLDRYGERIAGPYELYNDHSGGYYDNMLLRSLACYANTIIGDTNHPEMIMCPKTKKKSEQNIIVYSGLVTVPRNTVTIRRYRQVSFYTTVTNSFVNIQKRLRVIQKIYMNNVVYIQLMHTLVV